MDKYTQNRLRGHHNCFAFGGINCSKVECSALKVTGILECAKCKFFKTRAELEEENRIVSVRHEKLGLIICKDYV